MSPRTLAPIAAFVSVAFGLLGLVATSPMLSLFGITTDAAGLVVTRLACASYLAFGVLNWMARNVTDSGAWLAIASANAVGWCVGAVVAIIGILGLSGSSSPVDARAWLIPALQVVFTALWGSASLRIRQPAGLPSPSAA